MRPISAALLFQRAAPGPVSCAGSGTFPPAIAKPRCWGTCSQLRSVQNCGFGLVVTSKLKRGPVTGSENTKNHPAEFVAGLLRTWSTVSGYAYAIVRESSGSTNSGAVHGIELSSV